MSQNKALFDNRAVNNVHNYTNAVTVTFNFVPRTNSGGVAICQEDGSAGSSCLGPCMNVPSMFLPYVDPPFESFTIDGLTFNPPFTDVKSDGSETESLRNFYDKERFLPGATVIHEFCHALGMNHEHQNYLTPSSNPIVFVDNIIEKLKSEYGWTEANIKSNILDKYSDKTLYSGSNYDPDSIMKYPLRPDFLKSGGPMYPNYTLSSKDKEWLLKKYPKNIPESQWPIINVSFVDIRPRESWKKFWVKYIVLKTFSFIGVKFIFDMSRAEVNNAMTDLQWCSSMSGTGNGTTLTTEQLYIIGGVAGGVVVALLILIVAWKYL